MLKKLALIAVATGLAAQAAARLLKSRRAAAMQRASGAHGDQTLQRAANGGSFASTPATDDGEAFEPALLRRVRKAADRAV